MSKQGVLLGMGNPLLDISSDVTEEFVEKYGLKMGNAILCEDKQKPIYEDLIKNNKVSYIAGGSTQNSIRVAQWMLQTEGATSFIGSVGKDKYSEQLKECTKNDGVAVYYSEDENTPTGTCAVLINKKERSMVANLAAANNYKIDHLNSDEVKKVWQAADFFYIAGFFLTVSPPSLMEVAKFALEKKKTFAINLSAEFITQFFAEPLMEAIKYSDFVFGNETEAAAFGAKQEYKDQSVEGVALEIAKIKGNKDRTVVFTQGSKQTIVVKGDKVEVFEVPKLEEKDIVDVNGAGDAFVGGFLAALINGKDTKTCVEAGHYSASVILGVSGTNLPKDAPVFKFE